MKKIDEMQAIIELVGGAIGRPKNGVIEYLDGQTPPSESEINTKLAEMQAEWDAQAYARNRKEEYDLLNQLELQFDDEENGTTTWKDAINAIKAKYPKPE